MKKYLIDISINSVDRWDTKLFYSHILFCIAYKNGKYFHHGLRMAGIW